jgi:hypothetical protein
MKIQVQQIRDIVDAIFSKMGYNIKNFNIQFPHPLDIKIVRDEKNNIVLKFTESLPKVTWQKFITLTARISGISLGEKEGVLMLKYLPDVPFSYDDQSTESLFGQAAPYDFSDIYGDINSEYQDEERKILANKCLHYASEWATIANQSGSLSDTTPCHRRNLKRDCKNFVMDNIKNDPEIQAGSVILTFLFFYVVLPVVLKFVLERLFKKLFS